MELVALIILAIILWGSHILLLLAGYMFLKALFEKDKESEEKE